MRKLTEIIIHCAATPPEWMADKTAAEKVAEIDRWHKDRGWSGIGYHFFIDRNGDLKKGRSILKNGAHVKGHNTGTIGVCLAGGKGSNENDKFSDNFTEQQGWALKGFLADMQEKYPSIEKISGHNEYAAKACPGFQVQGWLDHKPTNERHIGKSTTLQATAATAVAGAGTVAAGVSELDGDAQKFIIVAGVIMLLALAWIARERIKAWGEGRK